MFLGKIQQKAVLGPDEIEWIVLKQDSKTMLLISKYSLFSSYYCDFKKATEDMSFLEWPFSLARERCQQFYETAFSDYEKEILLCKKTVFEGTICEDYVFLLTEDEVHELLPELNIRKAMPTYYALKNGARLGWTDDTKQYTSWWIMPEIEYISPGRIISQTGIEYKKQKQIYPKAVFQNGDIQYHGRNIYHGDFTIRPCVLVDYEKYVALKKRPEFSLEIMKLFEKREMTNMQGSASSMYDKTMHKWRMRIQLDKDGVWFLSVFIHENGDLDKYSLDKELANDSHYEFKNDKLIRKIISEPGDEKLGFTDVLIRYVNKYGGNDLLSSIYPHITAQYHF